MCAPAKKIWSVMSISWYSKIVDSPTPDPCLGVVRLVKIVPEKRMCRWYVVWVQAGLFEAYSVGVGWGSCRSAFQRWRLLSASSKEDAIRLAQKTIQKRIKRGYIINKTRNND
jgi:hypothetical protein